MKKYLIFAFASSCLFYSSSLCAAPEPKKETQTDYERSIGAVIRNKYFYKAGRFEIGGTAGVMPYDSLVNHYMFGGKATWHLTDHFGWEIIDAQVAFPSVTSYANSLVKDRGVSNLQTSKLKQTFSTNLLVSPVYGKIRFFGSQILYFDIYLVLGGGVANTETIRLSTTGTGIAATETSLRTGMEPMFDFGLGVKIFMNSAMGVIIDLRDYVVFAEVYGSKKMKSNFSVFAGFSFFLPTF